MKNLLLFQHIKIHDDHFMFYFYAYILDLALFLTLG